MFKTSDFPFTTSGPQDLKVYTTVFGPRNVSEIFAQKTLNADYSKAFSLTTLCHNVIDYSYFSSCKTTPNFVVGNTLILKSLGFRKIKLIMLVIFQLAHSIKQGTVIIQ